MLEIFKSIDVSSFLGLRNRLIMELLFATGIRVGELINIKIKDIDSAMGFGTVMYSIIFFNKLMNTILSYFLRVTSNIQTHICCA